MIISFLRVKRGSRKCRNWQTSKTKDLVIIAIVWVQVPSSALKRISNRISFFCAEDGLMNAFMITIPCNRVGCGRPVDDPREARSTDRAEGETKSRLPQICLVGLAPHLVLLTVLAGVFDP